jgi:hypothetical protein
MLRTRSLVSLRASLLAAMGLGLGACGGDVTTDAHTGASGGGGGSAGTTGTGGEPSATCKSPTVIPARNGDPTGFEKCADGTIRRVAAVKADTAAGVTACSGSETVVSCKADTDCTTGLHGKCGSVQTSGLGGPMTSCSCVYPCATDDECGKGQVCVSAGVVPSDKSGSFCAPASCSTGKDCPSGECGISSFNDGCGTQVQLACRNEGDACRLDADCPGSSVTPPGQCALTDFPNVAWRCATQSCAIGRPLLVEGRAQTAAAAERGDWTADALNIDLAGLDADTRAALSQHWLDVAALEHASVASFARFTLSLLSLGAPPALLADAQRAGLDEIEHAKLAYALAGAYAGRRFGPGPLDLSGVALSADRRQVLRSLIEEACVGETLGVAEALALAALARDPALRRAYERIAEDEQRHAELAFRTLAWLLDGADDATARFAARCFDEAMTAAALDPSPRARAAPELGLLSAHALGAIRRQALREVVAPCAAALRAPRGGVGAARSATVSSYTAP